MNRPHHRLACILAATLAMAAITSCSGSRSTEARFDTVPVSVGDLQQKVTATGSLSALVSVDVGSQVSGKIVALNADFNSVVKKNDLVAQIDPALYVATKQQAEGDLAGARADVLLKQQNLRRKQILVPLRAASQLDLDQATAELAKAEAAVFVRQAALASAEANVGYCRITAPVDGLVISRKVDLGQTVIAALNTPVLFTIARDIHRMNITADVSEADIGMVSHGQTVEFTVDAFPNQTFRGSVTQVRKSPTSIQNVVTYQTIISVDNADEKLFPGMTANVAIRVAERHRTLKVANAALRFSPPRSTFFDGALPTRLRPDERLVYQLSAKANELHPVVVRVGISDGVETEILPGTVAHGASLVTASRADKETTGFSPAPPELGNAPQ